MTIAFDIDGTWSLEPRLFRSVADSFTAAGWSVIIATGRQQPPDKLIALHLSCFPIIVSGPLLKEEAARRAGYKVDVWVDDMPGMIQRTAIIGEPADDSKL